MPLEAMLRLTVIVGMGLAPPAVGWAQRPGSGSLSAMPDYIVAYRYDLDDPQETFRSTIYDSRTGQYTAEVRAALVRWLDEIARNYPGSRAGVESVSISEGARDTPREQPELDAAIARFRKTLPAPLAIPPPGTDRRETPRRGSTWGHGRLSRANEETKEPKAAESLAGTTWIEWIPRNYGHHLTIWIYHRGAGAASGAFTMLEGYSNYGEFWPNWERGIWRQEGHSVFMDYRKANGRPGLVRSEGTIRGDVIEGTTSMVDHQWTWTQRRKTSKDRLPAIQYIGSSGTVNLEVESTSARTMPSVPRP